MAASAGLARDVELREDGDLAVLTNGVLEVTVRKPAARITSIRYRNTEMVRDGYYSMDGAKDYRNPSGCRFSVTKQTPDLVDIAMRQTWTDAPQAFDIEIHYVLRRGDSGLYSYALLDHPAHYPATRVGEWRFVWKLPTDLPDHIFVDDLRHRAMPSSRDTSETTPIREIVKYTSSVRAGKFECKYDYNASSTEVAAGHAWRKLYGPFLLYCNHTEKGVDASWADAGARARAEDRECPCAWLCPVPGTPRRTSCTTTCAWS